MPDIQESVGVTLIAAAQSAWGTAAASGDTAKKKRRISTGLNTMKDVFASNEVRADQQVNSLRHGGQRVMGQISGELSTESYDDDLAALMRSTWGAAVSLSQADLTSVVADEGDSKFTFGSGDPIALGLRVGRRIKFGGMSVAANNDVWFRIVSFGGSNNREVTVTPAPTDQTSDTGFTISQPPTLVMGTTQHLFTFEQNYPSADLSELFDSCRYAGASIGIPPNGNCSISFDVQGRRGQVLSGGSAPYFSAPSDPPDTEVLTGIEGGLRLAGVEQVIVTALDLNISHNMSSAPVIGTPYLPNIFYGRIVVTGNVSFFLKDETLLDAFINEEAMDLAAVAQGSGADPLPFLAFNCPRIKFTGAQKQPGPDGGVIVSAPFQAVKAPTSTGYDTSTLVIQRSNT